MSTTFHFAHFQFEFHCELWNFLYFFICSKNFDNRQASGKVPRRLKFNENNFAEKSRKVQTFPESKVTFASYSEVV